MAGLWHCFTHINYPRSESSNQANDQLVVWGGGPEPGKTA
jgi:hypothetical protein